MALASFAGDPGDEWAQPNTKLFTQSGETVRGNHVWTGAETIQVAIPDAINYGLTLQPQIIVRGRQSIVEHLRVDGGQFHFSALQSGRHSSIEVHIDGQALTSLELLGRGYCIGTKVGQETLTIASWGNGRVERMKIRIFGSGDVDLARLDAVDVNAFGSGDTDIAPCGDADNFMLASGDV